jgi:GGDEF domain-containing protein
MDRRRHAGALADAWPTAVRAGDARGRVAAPLGRAPVPCSGGIAAILGAGPDLASLYRAADAALYAVKRGGRRGMALAG